MDGEGIIFFVDFWLLLWTSGTDGEWIFFLVNCYEHGRKKQLDLIL
jgi:hypothetical protein